MFTSRLYNFSRLLTLFAPFVFLIPPRFSLFGLFLWHEFLFPVVVACAALTFVLARLFHWRSKDVVNTELTWMDAAVAVFFVAFSVATVFSQNTHASIFGTLDRMTGLVTIFYACVYYALLRMQYGKDIRAIIRGAALMFGLIAIYALLQRFFITDFQSNISDRSEGPFTNPAILASFLIFGVFLPVVGFFQESEVSGGIREKIKKHVPRSGAAIRWSAALFCASILSVGAIMVTQTRSALLGVGAGAVVFALLVVFDARYGKRAQTGARIFMVLIALAGVAMAIQIFFSPVALESGTIKRLTDPAELLSGIRNRALTWSVALESAKDHPFFGWGPDNFSSAFDAHFDVRLVEKTGASEAWFDKVHGAFLETLATTGVVGLAAYVGLFVCLLWAALRMRGRSRAYAPALALVLAYAFNNIFIFDSMQTYVALMLAAALFASELPRLPSLATVTSSKTIRCVGLAAGILPTLFLWRVALLPMHALAIENGAREFVQHGDMRGVSQHAELFDGVNPYERYMWARMSALLLQNAGALRGFNEKLSEELIHGAFDEFARVSRRTPMSARDYYMAGRLGNFMQEKKESDIALAREYLSMAALLSPENPNITYELASLERMRGNTSEAIAILIAARNKYPQIAFIHVNLGLVYLDEGNFSDANASFDRARELGYLHAEVIDANLGFAYLNIGDYDNAVAAFERAFEEGYVEWKYNPVFVDVFIKLYTREKYASRYPERLAQFHETARALGLESVGQ